MSIRVKSIKHSINKIENLDEKRGIELSQESVLTKFENYKLKALLNRIEKTGNRSEATISLVNNAIKKPIKRFLLYKSRSKSRKVAKLKLAPNSIQIDDQLLIHRNRRNYKKKFENLKLSMHKLPTAKLNQTVSIPSSNKVVSISHPEKESLDSLGFTDEQSSNMSLMSFTSSTSSLDKLKREPTARIEAAKPKLIDLEFKNELEKLFSNDKKTTKKKITTIPPAKSCQLVIAENNDKLRNIFSILTGDFMTDYSDLLVDFKEDFLDSKNDNKELRTVPASFKYALLNEATSNDNEKCVQYLIQVLVKSCRVFDVATSVNNSAMSYWRYANPVVAAFKQEGKIKLPVMPSLKSHAGTQTETESHDSIIEKLTETLSKSGGISYKLKKFRLDKKDESSESNSNNCKYTYLDSDQISDECNEEDIYIDLYDDEDEDENEYIHKVDEEEENAIVQRPLNHIRNGGQSMSRCRRHHYFNYQSSKKHHPHHSHIYFQYNNNKLMFHLNSRAQDETLRDAENISDIDDEIDIDQWADLPNNNNNNNNLNDKKFNESLSDKQRIPSGNEFNSNLINNYQDFKQNQNLKVVFTRPRELEHETKPLPSSILRKRDSNLISNNKLLSLSNRKNCGPRIKSSLDGSFRKRARQALSTSMSTTTNNSKKQQTCHLKIISDLSKKNSSIMSNFILMNTNNKKFERSASYWHDEKTSSSYTNQVERTHSMDSLENYEVEDDDEETNPKNLELSEIPEIKLNFEYKIDEKDSKSNFRFEDEDLIKKRTRAGLKFWKDEEEKRRQIEASTNISSSSSLSHSTASKPKPNHSPSTDAVQQSVVIAETIARVKDRINIFETKKKEEVANEMKKQLVLNKKVLPQPLIRVEQVETVVETTTNVNENHELLETTTIKRNVPVNFHTFQPRFESMGSQKKITTSRSIGNELDKTSVRDTTSVRIPIVLSNSSRSSSNIANNKSELSFSVESLNNKEETISDEEEEELEILIDMSHLDEGKRHTAVDERLRNIVMHMIPTTRKAYVDDIVDGVKLMLSTADLADIRSPVDLPAKVIKFVQKRYASLLNEQYSEASCSLLKPKKEGVEESAIATTTTELTVVKETRHEDFLKFEEDTLYIVEKKRNSESLEVDNEIRKSFELKARHETQVTPLNLKTLIDTLKYSIEAESESTAYWNDCQLHYFNVEKQQKQPVLIMFYDVKNKNNFKSNLEKQYHKSIVDTHTLNDKKQINLVATICIYICNQEVNQSLFEMFSLIKPPTTKEEIKAISLNKIFNSFPIGKYFVKLKYKVVGESISNKETIVDISLLPLPIRSQLIREYEYCIEVGAFNYPTFFLMALDKDRLQQSKEKQHESLITKRFKQFDDCLDEVTKQKVLADPLSFLRTFKKSSLPSIDTHLMEQFAKQLEIDLNSFYLCERVIDSQTGPLSDLILKLNKLDALACFDSVQLCTSLFNKCMQQDNTAQYMKQSKFTLATHTDQNETKLDEKIFDSHGNKFYFIDHGKHYKCVVPITDLPISQESRMQYTDNQFIKSVENLQHNSSLVIESMHSRKNYIFSRHLMNVSPYNKYVNLINLLMDKEYKIRDVEFNQIKHVAEVVGEASSPMDDFNLPSFSESTNDVSSVKTKSCFRKAVSAMKLEKDMEEQVATKKKTKNITEIDFASFETDRLKMDAEEASNIQVPTSEFVKNQRDKIIISEIDKMFSSIRDHQGSNAKARGELRHLKCQKKRSGSWGYSSNKRHVKAKVMDLPIADDISAMSNQASQEDSIEEKVFVRIDDYLNKEVSKILERSYSVDYLNQCAGPRIRIRYIRIPGHTIKTQSLQNTEPYQQVYEEPVISQPQLQTEYRSAPYDLRYWSILKLLDEERQQANGQVLSYFNETEAEWQNDKSLVVGKLDNQLSANELQTFMSMDDLDKEIEKVKKEQKLRLLSNSSSTFISTDSKKEVLNSPPLCYLNNEQSPMPRYIIKEKKMTKKQANCFIQPVFEKIDAELEKLEKIKKGDEAVAQMGAKTKSTGFRIIDRLFGLNKNELTSESVKRESYLNNFKSKKNDAQFNIQQFTESEAYENHQSYYNQTNEKNTSHITIVSKLQSLIPNNLANI